MSGGWLSDRLRGVNQRSLFHAPRMAGAEESAAESADEAAGPAGARAARHEAIQRLQVGLIGIATVVLVVGLASIIGGQADKVERLAVPEAAPTTEPTSAPAQANPLADAGVVPDIAAEPKAAPSAAPSAAPRDLAAPGQPGAAGNGAAQN